MSRISMQPNAGLFELFFTNTDKNKLTVKQVVAPLSFLSEANVELAIIMGKRKSTSELINDVHLEYWKYGLREDSL